MQKPSLMVLVTTATVSTECHDMVNMDSTNFNWYYQLSMTASLYPVSMLLAVMHNLRDQQGSQGRLK